MLYFSSSFADLENNEIYLLGSCIKIKYLEVKTDSFHFPIFYVLAEQFINTENYIYVYTNVLVVRLVMG